VAAQLQRNWVGKDVKPDEQLPFAPSIKKGALIDIVQDGLYMDHVQSQVTNEVSAIARLEGTPSLTKQRKYVFGTDHGPKFSVPADEPRERRPMRAESRISSAGEREMQNGTAVEIAPRQGPKRKRKSNGTERRTNGDMMDIDGPAGPAPTLDTVVPDVESPLPVIEEAPIVDTLTIGQSKESLTERPRDLFPDTSFIDFETTPLLQHVKWSPHQSSLLFTAGEHYMRTYIIRSPPPENGLEQNPRSGRLDKGDYSIDHFCWTEDGAGVLAVKDTVEDEEGAHLNGAKLMAFKNHGISPVELFDPMAGAIVALKYNPESKMLLSLSYGEMAVVKIFQLTDAGFVCKDTKTLSAELYDAAWTSDTKFIVCGISKLEIYEVTDSVSLIKSVDTPQDWFRLQVDKICGIVACIDEDRTALGIMKLGGDLKLEVEPFKDASITEFEFQPIQNKDSRTENTPRLLATSTANGKVQIWNALLPFTRLFELNLGKQSSCHTLSFSPDGFYIAAAGYQKLGVWKAEEGGEPKAIWEISEPNDHWNTDIIDGTDDDWTHTLSWDSDGKKIAFSLHNQVCNETAPCCDV
jgi:transducin (beta)-like 1